MKKIKTKMIAFNDKKSDIEVEFEVVVGKKCEIPFCDKFDIKGDFNIISKQIDEIYKMNAKLDENDFIQKVTPIIKEELSKLKKAEIKNQKLKRVKELINEYKLKEATKMLKKIDFDSLSDFEKGEYKYYEFSLGNKDELFSQMKEYFKNDIEKLTKIYFDYIKYLEDKREERKPYQLIKEFEEKFSLNLLNRDELSYFYYIKGRNYYYRGEYLLALSNLKKAKENVKNNDRLLASIYNTTANSFSDNLFFDEALQIAKNALKIRKEFNFPEIADTLSLIGGIYFKSGDLKNALKFYKKVLEYRQDDRIYNYLAKTLILQGDLTQAKQYLDKSHIDKAGFYFWIKTLYFYYSKQYDKIEKLYLKEFYCPCNRDIKDKFVIGWFFYIMSLVAIENKKLKKAKKYFSLSLEYFIKDNYILEADFVRRDILHNLKNKKPFKKVVNSFDLDSLFDEYMLKHKTISDDYKDVFDYKVKNNVQFDKIILF